MGYCGRCGTKLEKGACFCPSCGGGVSSMLQGAPPSKAKRAVYRMKPAADPRPYKGDVLAVLLLLGWQAAVLLLLAVSMLLKNTREYYWAYSALLSTTLAFPMGCVGCNRGMFGLGMPVVFLALYRAAALLLTLGGFGIFPDENALLFILRSLPWALFQLILVVGAWGLTYAFSGRPMALGCLLYPLIIWVMSWGIEALLFGRGLAVGRLLGSLLGTAAVSGAMFLRSAMAMREDRARAAG